jgi:hypothetical protein
MCIILISKSVSPYSYMLYVEIKIKSLKLTIMDFFFLELSRDHIYNIHTFEYVVLLSLLQFDTLFIIILLKSTIQS